MEFIIYMTNVHLKYLQYWDLNLHLHLHSTCHLLLYLHYLYTCITYNIDIISQLR